MKKLLALIAFVGASVSAQAYWTPIQVNLAGDAGIPWCAEMSLIRANILYGNIETTAGVDVGLMNRTTKNAYGIRAGLANRGDGAVQGLSVGVFNTATLDSNVFDVGLFNIAEGEGVMRGVQIGAVNGETRFEGLQIGVFQGTRDDMSGLQVGFYNGASHAKGVQLGILNGAYKVTGLQIGLICYNEASPVFPWLPLCNFGWAE